MPPAQPLSLLWSESALWVLLFTLALSVPALRRLVAESSPRLRWTLLGLVVAAVALRVFVVSFSPFRSEYAIYSQLETELALLDGEARPPFHMPGRGAILALLSPLVSPSLSLLNGLNVALAAALLLVAAAVAFLLFPGRVAAPVAVVALLAFDPVHARLTGDYDVNVLMSLCHWLAVLGILLDVKRGEPAGLPLAAAAAVFGLMVKLDSVFVFAGAALFFVTSTRTKAHANPRLRWTGFGAAVAWAGVSALVVRAIVDSDPFYKSVQLSFGPDMYLSWLANLPTRIFVTNPFVNAAYTPLLVPVLVVAGLLVAAMRPRDLLWLPAVFLLVLFRVFFDYVDWTSDAAQKGNLRWLFHGHLPWFLLAAGGAAALWERLPARVRWVLPVLVLASTWPARDFYTHRFSLQRENDFVLSFIRSHPAPCATAAAFPNASPYYPRPMLETLGRLDGWPAHLPHNHPDALAARGRLACALYYEGFGCFVRRGEDEGVEGTMRPACADVRARYDFEPVAVMEDRFEQYCGYPMRRDDLTYGFYRLVPRASGSAQ